jgi:hypothetical protein
MIASRTFEFEPSAPPWGWNPAATFLTAYTTMQENQRAQQEFAVQQELEQYLMPLKKQQAQLSLEKMNLEMEKTKGELTRQTLFTRMATDAYRNTNRGVNSAVAGNGGSSNQAPAQDEDPTSFNLTGTSYDRKSAAQSQPKPGSQPIAKKPAVDLTGV